MSNTSAVITEKYIKAEVVFSNTRKLFIMKSQEDSIVMQEYNCHFTTQRLILLCEHLTSVH